LEERDRVGKGNRKGVFGGGVSIIPAGGSPLRKKDRERGMKSLKKGERKNLKAETYWKRRVTLGRSTFFSGKKRFRKDGRKLPNGRGGVGKKGVLLDGTPDGTEIV